LNTADHIWARAGGPLLGALVYAVARAADLDGAACWAAAMTAWCILWWLTAAVPVAVTALLPMAVFPVVGVLDQRAVAESFGSPVVLLMLGGFLLSRAMEVSGAHRRIALLMVHLCGGGSSRRLVIGFMLASAGLSMWISNTATALMLLPVALAILERSRDPALAVPLMLGIAYAGSIGGIGTPIGTPPNLIFMQVYRDFTGTEISFLQWMAWALPVVALMLPLMALWLTRGLRGEGVELPALEAWTSAQRRVLALFGLCALAWITRTQPLGGWSAWLGTPGASDASVALLGAAALFLVSDGKGERLLDWERALTIPWGILLLFGGGICLARGFMDSGLGALIGAGLAGLDSLPLPLLVLLLCLAVTFMTEAVSNTAAATLLMPILAAVAVALAVDPRLLMVPAAMSASAAFMLPIATPPNAIVYASGEIPPGRMAREGLVLNLLGAVVITACALLVL
jgi:sodium-dependent dicarboxylate transporter 2/3/5